MGRFILTRFVYMIVAFWVVVTATFFTMHFLPGSPLQNQAKLPEKMRERIEEHYGLNDPLAVQYFRYLGDLVQGDLGLSFKYEGRSVNQIIAERIGPSAQLGVQALIFGTVVGVALGILAGLRQNTWIDYSSMAVAILSMSLPNFVLAAFLSYFVGVKLGWLPVALWEGFEYTILPTLTLSGTVIAMLARFMRTEMIEVLGQDYIKTAKAKGLSPSAVVWKHTIRNAMLPSVTVLGTIAINIVTGSLVIEQMFGVPGIGEQFVTSILAKDLTVIMGVTIFYSALFILTIFITDVLYGVIDPRIRLSEVKA